mgnify:CR=1 FL=1
MSKDLEIAAKLMYIDEDMLFMNKHYLPLIVQNEQGERMKITDADVTMYWEKSKY